MGKGLKTSCALVLAGLATSAAGAPPASAPDLRACPRVTSAENGDRHRTVPLPVPARFRSLLKSGLDHFAVATLGGRTVCADTSWVERADGLDLSPDGRFLSFRWLGYESYGFTLVDRAGRGGAHEIGARPVFSPSRRHFAAVDQSESEFGSLSGLKFWRVAPTAVIEIGKVEDIPRMYDWRIDGWVGEACLNLSALPLDQADNPKTRRLRYAARHVGPGWKVLPAAAASRCPAA